jgi:hypothetical protein
MNLGTFRSMLAGYIGREPGTFVSHGINMLDRAVNQARKYAERRHRFECARDSVVIRGLSLADGGLLSSAVSLSEQGRRVSVRTIERAFLPFDDGSGQFQVEVWSRDADMRDTGRQFAGLSSTDPRQVPISQRNTGPFRLVRSNDRVYLSPRDANTSATTRDVYMDVVMWLPDYVKDHDTDFFLQHCEDFMLLRSVYQLNFMLKEDQRVTISAGAMAEAWETVLAVDNDAVTGASDDANLD